MDWKQEFDSIVAPSPWNRAETVNLEIDKSVVQQMARQGWNDNVYAMFYNVAGNPPPVNNIGFHERDEGNLFPDPLVWCAQGACVI